MKINGVAFVVVLVTAACASNPAPPTWQRPAEEMPQFPFGMWIQLTVQSSTGRQVVAGEFLAVGTDSVYMLPFESPVLSVARSSVMAGTIAEYDARWGTLAGWAAGGALISPLVNGWLSAISFPIWVIGGVASTSMASHDALTRYPWVWPEVRKFARFPQGLPATVDRASLAAR